MKFTGSARPHNFDSELRTAMFMRNASGLSITASCALTADSISNL